MVIKKEGFNNVGDFESINLRGCECDRFAPPVGIQTYLIEQTTGEEGGDFWKKHPDDPGQLGRLVIPNLEELFIEIDYLRNARGPMSVPFGFKIEDLENNNSKGPYLYTQDNDSNPGIIDLDYGVSIGMMTAEERAMVISTSPIRIRIPYDGTTGYISRYGSRIDNYSSAISGPYRIYAKLSQPVLGKEVKYINW